MANESEAKVLQDFARDIASRLDEAAIVARTADGFCKQGLAEQAVKSTLEIEPLIHDAIWSSVVRRREHERGIDRVAA